MAHAGEDEDGDGGGEEQEKNHSRPHFKGEKLTHKQHERDAQQYQDHPRRRGGGKSVHVLVPEGRVLAEAPGHVAPQQGVHVTVEEGAQAQDGLRLRVGGVGLPLAHRLAGDFHFLRQVLLGHAGALAQKLQIFTECHGDDLLSRCPNFRADTLFRPPIFCCFWVAGRKFAVAEGRRPSFFSLERKKEAKKETFEHLSAMCFMAGKNAMGRKW